MTRKFLTVRVPEEELKILESFWTKHEGTKTDVIREMIRSLAISGTSNTRNRRRESMYPDAHPGDRARNLSPPTTPES
ncbi:MAG: hypothetical protein AB4426_24120 [Xenococcaceae cyanobacterium]